MSGFVGMLQQDGAPVDGVLLRQMIGYMAFRGPDAQAMWSEGPVGLGHAMLRTTRESEGERQPSSLDGVVWIAADARIDARAELLVALRAAGRFVAPDVPDAELILHAYHVWEIDCLERLIGDFGFVIWDDARQRLFAARDQFGVVPVFYAVADRALVVSNTLNGIRLHPDVPDDLNDAAVADAILLQGNRDLSATFFAGIRRLTPAHLLVSENSNISVRRYWALPEEGEYLRCGRPEEIVESFHARFRAAVGDRLRAPRLAADLSGGMDSTSVLVTACRLLAEQGVHADVLAHTGAVRWLLPEEEGRFAGELWLVWIPQHILLGRSRDRDRRGDPDADGALLRPRLHPGLFKFRGAGLPESGVGHAEAIPRRRLFAAARRPNWALQPVGEISPRHLLQL